MDPTADHRAQQCDSPRMFSTMFPPMNSPMVPAAPPQSPAFQFPWAHVGPQQQQGPQFPPTYEENSAYYIQLCQQWQMLMYQQQQQLVAQMAAGMAGIGMNVPVVMPHPQMHHNPHGMIQDPKTGQWLQQESKMAGQNAQDPKTAAPNDQSPPRAVQDPRMEQWAGLSLPNHPEPKNSEASTPSPSKPAGKDENSRKPFTSLQRLTLKLRFEMNPLIEVDERRELAKCIGLSQHQVKVWFQNQRRKTRREEKQRQAGIRKHEEQKKTFAEQLRELYEKDVVEQVERVELEESNEPNEPKESEEEAEEIIDVVDTFYPL